MDSKKQASVMRIAVIGTVLAAIILIAGTFWTGKSASADTEKALRSLQTGLNAHLSKPVQPETLFETLETMIS